MGHISCAGVRSRSGTAGCGNFPGGKLEPGESLFQGAHRELREELGVEVTAVDAALLSVSDAGSAFVIDFVPTAIVGEPTCLEHSELRWASPGELDQLDLAPSDRQFAHFLHSRLDESGSIRESSAAKKDPR
jgi:8-oxo-dGTP pyrophosphatase MutT (NUDIX family)